MNEVRAIVFDGRKTAGQALDNLEDPPRQILIYFVFSPVVVLPRPKPANRPGRLHAWPNRAKDGGPVNWPRRILSKWKYTV